MRPHHLPRPRPHKDRRDERFLSLCKDHWWFTNNPVEFGLFVVERIGQDGYEALRTKAFAAPPRPMVAFWQAEVDRLSVLLAQAEGRAS